MRHDRRRLVLAAICALALVLRLWAPGPTTETADEDLWLHRSQAFGTALVHGDLRHTTALGVVPERIPFPTMPGVTTMWAGTFGRALATASGKVGLSEPVEVASPASPQVLRAGRAFVSLFVVAGLAVIVAALVRLFGPAVGWISGVVLATEPWLVGHGGLLHTDAMVTSFSAASVLAAAVALRTPTPEEVEVEAVRWARRRWAVTSGVTAALAVLTKANAVGIVLPGVALVAVDALVRHGVAAWRHARWATGSAAPGWRPVGSGLVLPLRTLAVWTVALVVGVGVLWPALWVSAGDQFAAVWKTISQADLPRPKFFDGAVTTDPPATFYVVTTAFRLTPWALALVVVGLVGAAVRVVRWTQRQRAARRGERTSGPSIPLPVWLVASVVPYVVVVMRAPNKYDRYAMPPVPFLVAAGVIVVVQACQPVVAAWRARAGSRSGVVLGAFGVVAAVALAVPAVAQAPYALEYASPLLGGQRSAERRIPLGWGASAAELGATVDGLEGGDCEGVRVANLWRLEASVPCGAAFEPGGIESLATADYAVTLIAIEQRGTYPWYRQWLSEHATRVDTVAIDGVVYGELWRID